MRWFRFYDEVLDDPKVQRLPAEMFKAWVNLLCLANRHGGRLPPIPDVAFALRKSDDEMAAILAEFVEAQLLDRERHGDLIIHNWKGRQYQSDNAAERQRRHRERNTPVTQPATRNVTRNVTKTVTPVDTGVVTEAVTQAVTGTPSEAEADADSETEQIQKDPEQQQSPSPLPRADDAAPEFDEATPGPLDRRPAATEFHAAGSAVLEAIGVAGDPRWHGNYGRVDAWLSAGADLERDILPTVRRVMAKRDGKPPGTLKYFDEAIAEARDKRLAGMPPPTVHGAVGGPEDPPLPGNPYRTRDGRYRSPFTATQRALNRAKARAAEEGKAP